MGNSRYGLVYCPVHDLELQNGLTQLKKISIPGAGTPQPGQAISRRNTGLVSE